MVLSLNQITPLLLLGIVGFLNFYSRKLFFLAGMSLTLVAIKPHLAYLFWLALLLWIIDQRQWRIFYGALVGMASATLLPLLFVPDIFGFYLAQYATQLAPRPLDWQTPTLSTALGYLIGSNALWVRTLQKQAPLGLGQANAAFTLDLTSGNALCLDVRSDIVTAGAHGGGRLDIS
jgi:hypothetical protein